MTEPELQEILWEYTRWLTKCGYMDSDATQAERLWAITEDGQKEISLVFINQYPKL